MVMIQSGGHRSKEVAKQSKVEIYDVILMDSVII